MPQRALLFCRSGSVADSFVGHDGWLKITPTKSSTISLDTLGTGATTDGNAPDTHLAVRESIATTASVSNLVL